MDNITKFNVEPLTESCFVKPYRINYTQDGKDKIWDGVKSHDSVGILIYDETLKCFVLVKQFRPVVYQSRLAEWGNPNTLPPGSYGITYEICAGIVDKDKSAQEIAAAEVWEECGYQVSADRLEKISCLRSSIGIMGSSMTLFFIRVSAEDKKGSGGGLITEGELIDIHLLPLAEIESFIHDENILKPTSLMFALLWFMKYHQDES